MKIPSECKVFKTSGNFTFLYSNKDNVILFNNIDEKTNKLQWKEITNRKVWDISTL